MDNDVYDAERAAFLESKGFRVMRFWNNDISTIIDEVIVEIERVLGEE